MALFSLLVAILVERLRLLPSAWQFDTLLPEGLELLFGKPREGTGSVLFKLSELQLGLAILLPAALVYIAGLLVAGVAWGSLSLLLWVLVAIVCFSHDEQRASFKHYIQAACRGDVQACYHHAEQLDCSECLDAVSEKALAARVGQSVAWVNYRYYGAVALYFILLGPVGAVLYCTVRYCSLVQQKAKASLPLVDALQWVLDWLPSRIFALFYVLSGDFKPAFASWRRLALDSSASARSIIIDTAVSAEELPEPSEAPVCVQPTLALLALTKRNFVLLVTALSLLTIFGVVS
ncbi:beta-lactamase regulator AmpE [Shewanella cyperi]|uniref:beta-lactamase regulator AmpE n=1 Tax=Shewanella cyperi TaxID=2814292 RepID=UPI001A94E9C0|nr:beta-lactamase regulator AmpE [Shewanella cyperi]QSX40526.1 beta-lactamase regulator AmpE [Shewanella cyperi]